MSGSARPIRLLVQGRQEEQGEEARNWTKVLQVYGNAAGAVEALQAMQTTIASARNEQVLLMPLEAFLDPGEHPEGSSLPPSSAASFCSALGDGDDGLSLGAEAGTLPAPDAAGPQEGASRNSPMQVLLSHLRFGSPVQAKWMWGDVGLSELLPAYKVVAEANPWRWSGESSLEDCSQMLDDLVNTRAGGRPVRLQICSRSDCEEITFVTTTRDVAAAGSIVYEILVMVTELAEAARGRDVSYASFQSLWSDGQSCPPVHSFGTDALAATRTTRSWTSSSSPHADSQTNTKARPFRPKMASTNSNKISHYQWLEEVLQMVVSGGAQGAAEDGQQRATPLFVVAGACPNSFSSTMQAIVFCQTGQKVNFWFIKPSVEDPRSLERNTLNHHSSGLYKNAAGRSRAVYAPLVEKFSGVREGDFKFGVEEGRAFIDDLSVGSGRRQRMLVYFVWQESWSGVMARRKFIKGKIFYQWRGLDEARFFAREYLIEDSQLAIAPRDEEEVVPSLLPPDHFQDLYA